MSSQRSTQTDFSGGLIPAIILFGSLSLLLIGLLASQPAATPAKTSAASATPVAGATTVAADATQAPQTVAVALDPAKVRAGESSFQTICSACHGFNALGIPGLGKPLIGSEFVNSQTDEELLAFLQVGRAVTDPLNTTGVQMPPRGGNPNFTDDQLLEIISYIRSLNEAASQSAAGTTPTPAPTALQFPTSTPGAFSLPDLSGLAAPTSIGGSDTTTGGAEATTEAPVATSSSSGFALPDLSGLPVPTSLPGNSEATVEAGVVPTEVSAAPTESSMSADAGQALYVQQCTGCHADDGSGVQYVAKPLSESKLMQAKDDAGLLAFLIDGDPALNPPHPYRGGYPQLSDDELKSIIAYLYTLPTSK